MKTAIIVLSDPRGGEEALGRLFNALAAAHDFKSRKEEVSLVFQGTGTRWAAVLDQADHPAHALYQAVRDTVDGASYSCASLFGAREEVEKSGLELLTDNAVPGTNGLPSLAGYAARGYSVMTF